MDAWVQSIVSALVGGVVGGVSVGLTLQATDSRGTPPPAIEARDVGEGRGSDPDLERRLAELEAELRTIRRHDAAARALGEYARAMASAEGDAAPPKITPVVDAEDPVFELAVRSVVDRVDEERRDERRARRAQRAEERARSQAEYLAEQLQLSPEVRDRVQQLLIEQMERFRELRRSDPDAGVERPRSREQWREQVEAIRKDTERKLSEVLTDEQLQEYRKLREQEGFERGGRRERRER